MRVSTYDCEEMTWSKSRARLLGNIFKIVEENFQRKIQLGKWNSYELPCDSRSSRKLQLLKTLVNSSSNN